VGPDTQCRHLTVTSAYDSLIELRAAGFKLKYVFRLETMFMPLLANPNRLISRVLLGWYGPQNIRLGCNDLHNLKSIGLLVR
jgi:hypothetical protein